MTDGLVGSYRGLVAGGTAESGSVGDPDVEFRFRASEVRERPTVSHFQSLSTVSLTLSHTHAHTHLHTCTHLCTQAGSNTSIPQPRLGPPCTVSTIPRGWEST